MSAGSGRKPFLLRDKSGDYTRGMLAEASGFDGEADFLSVAKFGSCTPDSCIAEVSRGERRWRLLAFRSHNLVDWSQMVAACRDADIVVADRRLPPACQPRWLKLDRIFLERSGGIAISLRGKPSVRTVADNVGSHPWRAIPPRPNTKLVAQ